MKALIAALVVLIAPLASAQMYEGVELVKAQLIADTTAIQPGKAFKVGLHLKMAPHWHTYWRFAGDAGIPTSIKWDLPPGLTVSDLRWPVPERLLLPGDILDYGYSGEVMLLATVTPSEELSGENVTLKAHATWLVCGDICVPGSQDLSLELPVGDPGTPVNAELFAASEAALPRDSTTAFETTWTKSTDGALTGWKIHVEGDLAGRRLEIFPIPSEGEIVGHPKVAAGSQSADVTLPVDTWGNGLTMAVFAVFDASSGKLLEAWTSAPQGASASPGSGALPSPAPAIPIQGIWLPLLYGLLGGLILNVMPCVLPVISLKLFSLIRQRDENRGRIAAHGLAFSAGVYLWFLGIAVILIAIRAAGHQISWAFQFQNPYFVLAICAIVFVFALNLLGIFEIFLPGKASTAMSESCRQEGLGGSFAQGLFATLLATPCTAPFLGTALGFAFAQPAWVILAMFGSISTGMALPYLILTMQPSWMRFLPRPGPWMEKLKQFMAFPLLATALWLLSVIAEQKGTAGVLLTGALLLCLWFACWVYGSFCQPTAPPLSKWGGALVASFAVFVGVYFFAGKPFAEAQAQQLAAVSEEGGIVWEAFTEAKLNTLLEQRRPVFLDFTAQWCVTCKFNERTAIDRPAVRRLFAEKNVVPLKADWTNHNPEITAALKRFNRVGVPLYVLYPPGGEPIVLPELLTEGILVNTLQGLPDPPTNRSAQAFQPQKPNT